MALGQNKVPEYRFRRSNGFAWMRDLIDFAKFIAPLLKFKVSVDGVEMQEITGGVHIKAGGGSGASATPFPFKATLGSGESGLFVTIYPGTVSGVMPTIGGVALDVGTPPQLTLSGSGVQRIYLEASVTLSVNAVGYVTSYTGLSVTIAVDTSVPSDDTSGTYRRQIASVVDGVITGQVIQNSLDIVVRDSGAGGGTATAIFQLSG